MRTFDRILTWIAIICVLVLATMGVVSADSWTPNGELDGYIYQPYINFDFLEIVDQSGNRFILDLNTVVESLPDQKAAGYVDKLYFDFSSSQGNVNAPISIRFDNSSSNDNLICQMRIDLSEFPEYFDSPMLRFVSSDQICNISSTWMTSDYLPGIRLYSPDYDYPSFNMAYTATVTYFESNMSNVSINRKFSEDFAFSSSWSNLTNSGGRTSIYRLSNINNAVNSKQTDNAQYISHNGGLNTILVNDYQVDISTNENISSLMIYLPYVKTQPTYSQYLDGFSFGSAYETIIQTTVVEVPFDGYPDFTTFLRTSVGGFMNFGFFGITFASILLFIVGIKLVRALLNFFAGG